MMKGKERPLSAEENKILIGLIRRKNGGKIIIKFAVFAAITPRSYFYCVRKYYHQIENSESILICLITKCLTQW